MSPDEINQQKDVEFYAAGTTAWFNSALERDKSLLTLSAAGIGLLLTLLTTVGVSDASSLVLYISALGFFVATLLLILVIFRRNCAYLEGVVHSTERVDDPFLQSLDRSALASFGAAILLTAVIGVSAAVDSYAKAKEKAMANTNKPVGAPETVNKSFNGATNLRPPAATTPAATTPAAATTPGPAATPAPASTGASNSQSSK